MPRDETRHTTPQDSPPAQTGGQGPYSNYLRVNASAAGVNFTREDGTEMLRGCSAAIELSDGTVLSTLDEGATWHPSGPGTNEMFVPGTDLRPSLRWTISEVSLAYSPEKGTTAAGPGLTLRVEVENTTPQSLKIERFDVLRTRVGTGTAWDELEIAQTGWQSWSPAAPAIPLPEQLRQAPAPVIAPNQPRPPEGWALMPWVAFMRAVGTEEGLLAGFTSARRQQSVIAAGPGQDGHSLRASCYIEGVELRPGDTLRSETLLLFEGLGEWDSLRLYGHELAAEMGARRWPGWPHIPSGWCSWYYFFTAVSEADVLRNLEVLEEMRRTVPVEYVQLDDGYQAQIGDWLTPNDKFPSGMPYLTGRIREGGYTPGIWLAPFLLDARSQVYADHPDWVVRDENGAPIVAMVNWGGEQYPLDVTHPEAARWLRHVIEVIVGEWGYDYLKIDFIYAGCLRGLRYDRTCTGVEAYRRGVELIREAAGDRFILGCGAPFAPSVGIVDGMRIGPDVAPYWRAENDTDGTAPGMENAVRSTLAHLWMHGTLWANDPDCLMVRERDSSLTIDEVRSWASIVAVSGGMALVSDDLGRLEPERAAILPGLFPAQEGMARTVGDSLRAIPVAMRLDVPGPGDGQPGWQIAALFNWQDTPAHLRFDPSRWGAAKDSEYHLFESWSGKHHGPLDPASGPVDVGEVAPHGVRLLSVRPHLGRPQVVGSTLHLLQGAVEIQAEEWVQEENRLRVRLACPGLHEGYVAVYLPEGYTLDRLEGTASLPGEPIDGEGKLLRVPVRLEEEGEVNLYFGVPRVPA